MIPEPMLFQPIGIGMAKDQPALTAKINEVLHKLDHSGEINKSWDKWLGPDTEYRTDKVAPHQAGRLPYEAMRPAFTVRCAPRDNIMLQLAIN